MQSKPKESPRKQASDQLSQLYIFPFLPVRGMFVFNINHLSSFIDVYLELKDAEKAKFIELACIMRIFLIILLTIFNSTAHRAGSATRCQNAESIY